jgi:hypothetical protein
MVPAPTTPTFLISICHPSNQWLMLAANTNTTSTVNSDHTGNESHSAFSAPSLPAAERYEIRNERLHD